METIVITKMYSGEYLTDEKNLGGEIINLFKADSDKNYIYVNPYGQIDNKYDNTVSTVIMTGPKKDHRQEIVGIALIPKDGQLVYKHMTSRDNRFGDSGAQIKNYTSRNPITYGGATLAELHNGHQGGLVTFLASEVLTPKLPLFITNKESNNTNIRMLPDKHLSNQAQTIYITNKNNPESFSILKELINDKTLWDRGRSSKITPDKPIKTHFNFLSIIHKEDDELVFSNMISYFLSEDRILFQKFCKKILNVDMDKNAEIIREKENIDIYIEDKNSIIVIENKIKSNINGIEKRHDFSEDGQIQSQLQKYYDFAEREAERKEKKTHYFIFLPNYSTIDIKKYSASKNYQLIHYSQLYDFFRKEKVVFNDWRNEKPYYIDFCNSLYRHTKNRENDFYDDMEQKFLQRIKNLAKSHKK